MKYTEEDKKLIKEGKIGSSRNYKRKGYIIKTTETFYIYESKMNTDGVK